MGVITHLEHFDDHNPGVGDITEFRGQTSGTCKDTGT